MDPNTPATTSDHQDDTSIAGKKTAKLRRSCESCRNSKGRCIPSQDDPLRCLRCLKDGKQCVFLEAKPRPKRAKNSRTRVAEMEEKLEGLLATLSSGQAAQKYQASPRAVLQPLSQQDGPPFVKVSATLPLSTSGTSDSAPQFPFFAFPELDSCNDVISKGLVNFQQAEDFLVKFRSQALHFPFVILPSVLSLDSLRRQRPFLLHSILCCAAEVNLNQQCRLELALRENLSKRAIVDCEKSLDLIQGILVYLAWYHFYFNPEREQIYQLCQMASAMVIDLRIDKPGASGQVEQLTSSNVVLPVLPTVMTTEEIERRRCLLGCYYLTSAVSQGLRKPNMLKYTNYMGDCAQSVAQAGEVETDFIIPYIIRIQKLAEDISHAFDYASDNQLPQRDGLRVELLAVAFEQQIDHMQATFPTEVWENVSLEISFNNLRIYVSEIGFHAARPSEYEQTLGQSWWYSPARNEGLIKCLKAAKHALDRVLSLSSEAVARFTLKDFLHLIYAVLVVGAFATNAHAPLLDVAQVRQLANFEYYVLALKAQSRALFEKSPEGANHYFSHIYDLFQQSHSWHSQMALGSSSMSPFAIDRLESEFQDINSTVASQCVDFSTSSRSGSEWLMSEISSDAQWSGLVSGWTPSLDSASMLMDENDQFQA